ncbi:phosphate ABC transporter substrate-binding protein PstS [Leptolyngbya sp. FACHB-261]|uniref:phosphate ABC transporter substrate-binding protein PstS n=1 Tax=Leptolyngbya sp. FACHB-261 TaxID=2692806 RepID=UPI001683C6C7|nr:phosphate ABC transporter substrate-binding protein PstS [Leptolyngbya sp. FACHB-261]MBD2099393.1 phosphate ABC transporter substrate-binding protein PstS [Leptolyngbya sp. FACHB-261]
MFKSRRITRRVLLGSLVGLTAALAPTLGAVAQRGTTLNGAGATFPQPLYQRWFSEFGRSSGARVNYQAIGSGGGINQLIAGTVDFAGSDAIMTSAQIQRVGRGVHALPMAGGGVVVTYNLPGVSQPLRLSRDAYSDIFTGQITRWNDAKIASTNPGVNLPNQPIRTVVRADSSGTSFIFSTHLAAVDPYFRGRVGASTTPRWIQGTLRGQGNPGVAATVRRTPYSVGYVEYAYARQNNLPSAVLQNKAGRYITPSLQTFDTGLDSVTLPADFRAAAPDPAGAEAYPIVGYTWLLVYRKYPSADKANAIKALVRYAMNQGQQTAPQLQYVTVPSAVRQRVIQTADSISVGN